MCDAAQADAAALRAAKAALEREVGEASAQNKTNADLIGDLIGQQDLAAVRSWPGPKHVQSRSWRTPLPSICEGCTDGPEEIRKRPSEAETMPLCSHESTAPQTRPRTHVAHRFCTAVLGVTA